MNEHIYNPFLNNHQLDAVFNTPMGAQSLGFSSGVGLSPEALSYAGLSRSGYNPSIGQRVRQQRMQAYQTRMMDQLVDNDLRVGGMARQARRFMSDDQQKQLDKMDTRYVRRFAGNLINSPFLAGKLGGSMHSLGFGSLALASSVPNMGINNALAENMTSNSAQRMHYALSTELAQQVQKNFSYSNGALRGDKTSGLDLDRIGNIMGMLGDSDVFRGLQLQDVSQVADKSNRLKSSLNKDAVRQITETLENTAELVANLEDLYGNIGDSELMGMASRITGSRLTSAKEIETAKNRLQSYRDYARGTGMDEKNLLNTAAGMTSILQSAGLGAGAGAAVQNLLVEQGVMHNRITGVTANERATAAAAGVAAFINDDAGQVMQAAAYATYANRMSQADMDKMIAAFDNNANPDDLHAMLRNLSGGTLESLSSLAKLTHGSLQGSLEQTFTEDISTKITEATKGRTRASLQENFRELGYISGLEESQQESMFSLLVSNPDKRGLRSRDIETLLNQTSEEAFNQKFDEILDSGSYNEEQQAYISGLRKGMGAELDIRAVGDAKGFRRGQYRPYMESGSDVQANRKAGRELYRVRSGAQNSSGLLGNIAQKILLGNAPEEAAMFYNLGAAEGVVDLNLQDLTNSIKTGAPAAQAISKLLGAASNATPKERLDALLAAMPEMEGKLSEQLFADPASLSVGQKVNVERQLQLLHSRLKQDPSVLSQYLPEGHTAVYDEDTQTFRSGDLSTVPDWATSYQKALATARVGDRVSNRDMLASGFGLKNISIKGYAKIHDKKLNRALGAIRSYQEGVGWGAGFENDAQFNAGMKKEFGETIFADVAGELKESDVQIVEGKTEEAATFRENLKKLQQGRENIFKTEGNRLQKINGTQSGRDIAAEFLHTFVNNVVDEKANPAEALAIFRKMQGMEQFKNVSPDMLRRQLDRAGIKPDTALYNLVDQPLDALGATPGGASTTAEDPEKPLSVNLAGIKGLTGTMIPNSNGTASITFSIERE